MLLDVPVENIFEFLKHDGSKIIFPDFEEPYCRQGFHMQEMVDFALLHNVALIPFTDMFYMSGNSTIELPAYRSDRIPSAMSIFDGIVISDNHAYAYWQKKYYDPNWAIWDDRPVLEFWALGWDVKSSKNRGFSY